MYLITLFQTLFPEKIADNQYFIIWMSFSGRQRYKMLDKY